MKNYLHGSFSDYHILWRNWRRTGGTWRALDIFAAVVLLIYVAPLLLLAALAVWMEGGSPVIVRASRTAPDNAFPFRTLRIFPPRPAAGESNRPPAQSPGTLPGTLPGPSPDQAARMTRVGRVLRRVQIDRLPGLLDVAAGRAGLFNPHLPGIFSDS